MCGRLKLHKSGQVVTVNDIVPCEVHRKEGWTPEQHHWAGFARSESFASKWAGRVIEARLDVEAYAERSYSFEGETWMQIPEDHQVLALLVQHSLWDKFSPGDLVIVTREPWDEFSRAMHPRHPVLIGRNIRR